MFNRERERQKFEQHELGRQGDTETQVHMYLYILGYKNGFGFCSPGVFN